MVRESYLVQATSRREALANVVDPYEIEVVSDKIIKVESVKQSRPMKHKKGDLTL